MHGLVRKKSRLHVLNVALLIGIERENIWEGGDNEQLRIVLEDEAYVRFGKIAQARETTTRDLGKQILLDWISKQK